MATRPGQQPCFECDQAKLRGRARKWLDDHDATLHKPPAWASEAMRLEAAQLGYAPEVADIVHALGVNGVLEGIVWETFLAGLPSPVADACRRCIVMFCGRTGELNAVVSSHPGEGALIRMDWGVLLMWSDILRHALTLMSASEQDGKLTIRVSDPPDDETVRAAASLIWSFRQPSRGFRYADVPPLTRDRYTGEPAFGKILSFGEDFLMGHEVAHGLVRTGHIGEAPGIRAQLREWFRLKPEIENTWVSELSADLAGLNFVAQAASGDQAASVGQAMAGVAVAACLIAMSFIGLLERTVVLRPDVELPLSSDSQPEEFNGLIHPPAELRMSILMDLAEQQWPDAITVAAPYQDAINQLLTALWRCSEGHCVAPIGDQAWCPAERGPRGWLCERHGAG
jgi:hypothetical protein